jgi:hypothetical protein
MPQVITGQIQPGQGGAPALYGTKPVENTLPFQERLMRRFSPQDFVVIKNIDDEAVYWQYLPAHHEQKDFTPDGMQQITTRQEPEMWTIEAGAQEVLVGASAYMALDVMYKNTTAKMTLKRSKNPNSSTFDAKGEHLPKNFNFADGGLQEDFIDQAYLGKANPTFNATPVSESVNITPSVLPDDDVRAKSVNAAKETVNATPSLK